MTTVGSLFRTTPLRTTLARAVAGGDRHAIMVNRSTCTLYELWEARYSASGSTAGSGAIWSLTSNHLRPAGSTSADAAGLPILPGLLNYGQVQAAVRSGRPITHAIRFTAQATQSAYLWPARHEAGRERTRRSRRWAPGSG
jgi:hypothetical protein